MTLSANLVDDLKRRIIEDPDVILDDRDVMRALAAAGAAQQPTNVVDLRGIAMERLEARLERLEDTHRTVIAAAYENLTGTNQIHRAVLRLLEAVSFDGFLHALEGDLVEILAVDSLRLLLETHASGADAATAVNRFDSVVTLVEPGFSARYAGQPGRPVVLRRIRGADPLVHGSNADWIASEACIQLDFGEGRLPGLLALGAEDPHQFAPNQGTDLLTFFGAVFERAMRRWLA